MFAVTGIDYKSRLLFLSGTIDGDKYIENLGRLGFTACMQEFDEKLHATLRKKSSIGSKKL
jgi:hypothetical protein